MWDGLVTAIPHVFEWQNVAAMILGTLAGIVFGALPGLTATMGVGLLIPFTFTLDPLTGLLAMAGMYNGAIYGGSVAAVLVGVPGTPASVATVFDGHVMARKGEGTYALQVAAVSSAMGGIVSAVALIVVAPALARFALQFGPAEYFWVAVFGLSSVASFLESSTIKGLISAGIGLLVATVGTDKISGAVRFSFGNVNLMDGFPEIVILIGLYSIPQVLTILEEWARGLAYQLSPVTGKGRPLFYNWRNLWPVWLRSSLIGIWIGIVPGAGGNVASFLGYNEAKRSSRHPERFGTGIPEGVAASETANNAETASAMIPMLTLGVPGNAVTAVMIGGLLVHGLHPGPSLFQKDVISVYGLMIGMLLTNVLFMLMGFYGARFFAQLLRVPSTLIAPLIVALSAIGTYSLNNSMWDVYAMLAFGLLGYVMQKLRIPVAPAVLAVILGPMAEYELRRALLIAASPLEIFTRPISAVLAVLTVLSLVIPVIRRPRASGSARGQETVASGF
ncbi:MAG: tripartite tricarboxylate transporter permease [Bacillota bacterium]